MKTYSSMETPGCVEITNETIRQMFVQIDDLDPNIKTITNTTIDDRGWDILLMKMLNKMLVIRLLVRRQSILPILTGSEPVGERSKFNPTSNT